ncbi:MAG TPA: hypothetical protein IAA29_05475 [Candidatus Paenibacillus intestinavium]|nr:hypothetical protein [Candidatus Paenibacillus intestinavium]
MDEIYVHAAAITIAVLFGIIAIFQLLLTLGLPLGELTMGGVHKGKLPIKHRLISFVSIFILILFGLVSLYHANVMTFGFNFDISPIFIWGITAYLGLNTIANYFSKSPKEKWIMTPLSGITFLLLLIVAIYS